MARCLDGRYGGWQGVEHWGIHHEPFCCRLSLRWGAVFQGGRTPRDKEHWFAY